MDTDLLNVENILQHHFTYYYQLLSLHEGLLRHLSEVEGCVDLEKDRTTGLGLLEILLHNVEKRGEIISRYFKVLLEGSVCHLIRGINCGHKTFD